MREPMPYVENVLGTGAWPVKDLMAGEHAAEIALIESEATTQ